MVKSAINTVSKETAFSIFFILLMGSVFVLLYQRMPPQIPLLYSLPDGEAQVVDIVYILLLPTIMVFFVFLNIRLHRYLADGDGLVREVVRMVNYVVVIIIGVIFIRIILLVT